jgi:S-DNA-T family DNA segregation ATPase FtsK/SpoIIIE
VCLATDELAARSGRLLGRFAHRLVLQLANPADAGLFDLPAKSMATELPPGRALYVADGNEVQLPLVDPVPSGEAQQRALIAISRQLAAHPATSGPARVDALPRTITTSEADALGPRRPSRSSALIGVSGDELAAVWLDLAEYTRLVVTGPPRSGRSTAVSAVAVSAAAGGARVLLAAPRFAEVHEQAAAAGVVVVGDDELGYSVDLHRPDVLVLDDADRLTVDDALVGRLSGDRQLRIVVAARLDWFSSGYGQDLARSVQRDARAQLLLSPADSYAADRIGVKIRRDQAFSGPPGRALIAVDGEVRLGQLPRLR